MPVIVYKLGGSLLDLPDLPQRLRRVVPGDVSPLFVVGGGAAADLVRQWDRVHSLGEEQAHWLALASMRLNEALLAALLPDAMIVTSREEAAAAWQRGGWAILSGCDFVRAEEPSAPLPLPHTWDATSDSVAAWVAALWPADGLVLLKSVELPASGEVGNRRSRQSKPEAQAKDGSNPSGSFACASGFDGCVPEEGGGAPVQSVQSGALDACFSEIARAVPVVEWINLRDDDPTPRRIAVGPTPSPRETASPPPR